MHKKVFGLRAIKSRREAALNHSDATNIERSTQTDAAGYYFFAVLPVGTYDVTAEVAGFQTTKHLEAPWMPLRRSSHRRTGRSEASWTIRFTVSSAAAQVGRSSQRGRGRAPFALYGARRRHQRGLYRGIQRTRRALYRTISFWMESTIRYRKAIVRCWVVGQSSGAML
jgi:hypothetical protein